MRLATLLPCDVKKEMQGLLPLWAACILALLAAWISPSRLLREAAVVAYIVGPLAIGAHAVGQEHSHQTLAILLSQPIDRRRTYLTKMAVAAAMVLTLAALASGVLIQEAQAPGMWRHATVQVLPIAGGLGAAPWFAMICRSTLAGLLFTGSVASLTWIAAVVAAASWSGTGMTAAQAAIIGPWSLTMIAFCAVAGCLGVREFMHLQAIDGPPAALNFPRRVSRVAGVRCRRPIAALIAKEIHLQQLTFVLAAVFTAGLVTLSILKREMPSWSNAPTEVVTLIYCAGLAILIGALASAEERQQGTLEWQLLQPVPSWQQWIVKAAVSFALALLFGAQLPALLLRLTGATDIQFVRDLALPVVLLTAGTLYISSLATSGVRAMLWSLPAGVGTALLFQAADRVIRRGTFDAVGFASHSTQLSALLPYGVALTATLLLLRLAFVNHTSADRPLRRIVLHAVVLAAAVVVGAATVRMAAAF